MGKKFTVVTANTSLIILDAVQDYVSHEIMPPLELQKEYFALLKTQDAKNKDDENLKLSNVYKLFKTQVDWQGQDWIKINKERIEKAKQDSIVLVQQANEARKLALEKERIERIEKIKNDLKSKLEAQRTATLNAKNKGKKKIKSQNINPTVIDGLKNEQEVLEEDVRTVSTNTGISEGREIIIEEQKEVVTNHNAGPSSDLIEMSDDIISDDIKPVGNKESHASSIELKAWDPTCAYLDSMKKAAKENQYDQYLSLLTTYSEALRC